jgi:hypothetical protein
MRLIGLRAVHPDGSRSEGSSPRWRLAPAKILRSLAPIVALHLPNMILRRLRRAVRASYQRFTPIILNPAVG